jgi:acyl-CoA hydrolase
MIIGIKVEAENIRTSQIKHCNSSYFTMVAKDVDGNKAAVPGLILSNTTDLRRFLNCVKQIALKKEKDLHEEIFDYTSKEAIASLSKYNVKVEF